MSIGVHATKRAKLRGDDTVVVFGAGPIGLSVLFAARESGAPVLMVDPLERRLELAARLGAETHQWTDRPAAVQAALDWTDGEGPSVVFDATGLPDAICAACEAVVRAGRVVIIGQTTLEVTLPVAMFTAKELTILGSQNNSGVFEETLRMVEADPDWVREMISHRFPFADVLEAFEFSVANADKTVKVLIEMPPAGSS
jgi:L-gulonate 5-dehydrogenase